MNLSLDEIRSATLGAVRVEETADGIHFYRFTEAQTAFYKTMTNHPGFHSNTFTTAGVKFRFRTDSPTLALHICVKKIITRSYFSLDIFADGELVGEIRNYDERRLPYVYVTHPLPTGEFFSEFRLGQGEKEVCIHLPWNMETVVKELSLADGASFEPVLPEKKLLCFGDSITQGFDALRPSRRYTAQLAQYLGLEEVNKGIGGSRFPSGLSALKDPFTPEIITVAYGTNDWRLRTTEVFEKNCREFFVDLCASYPETPILAITPLWRKDAAAQYQCGPFRGMDEAIRRLTADLENITVLDGYHILPHSIDYFADREVHPNHVGIDRYFEALKAHFEANK